jgi:hypothetical protein
MLDFIAEQRLAEAVSKGELEDLPGAGQPLDLEEDKLVPQELRLAYRILKNAGCVPAEVEKLKLAKGAKKLELLGVLVEPRYYRKAIARLAR